MEALEPRDLPSDYTPTMDTLPKFTVKSVILPSTTTICGAEVCNKPSCSSFRSLCLEESADVVVLTACLRTTNTDKVTDRLMSIIIIINKVLIKVTLNKVIAGALYDADTC